MPYLDETYLQEMLGTDEVAALRPTALMLARSIEGAEAETETALMNAGYQSAVPSTVYATVSACPKAIRLLAYGAWLELVYGAKNIELPAGFRAYVQKLDLVRTGKMELPGVDKGGASKDTTRGVGGVSFSDSSETSDEGKPQIFSRTSMADGGY